jgi:hypothetical protein
LSFPVSASECRRRKLSSTSNTKCSYASFFYQTGTWDQPRKVVAAVAVFVAAGRANHLQFVFHTVVCWLARRHPADRPLAAEFTTIQRFLIGGEQIMNGVKSGGHRPVPLFCVRAQMRWKR